MVKKKQQTDELDDLDFGDLDDLGGDIDFAEDGFDDPDRTPSRSEVAKELAQSAGQSFIETVSKKTAEKALPSEYSSNYTEIADIASFAGEVVDRNKEKLDKSLFKLGKEVKKLLPMQIGLLDRYLERKEEEFAEFRQQTEDEMRNSAIASELATIFDKQLEIQKAIEAKSSAEREVDTKRDLVATNMNLELLRSIDANAAMSAAFSTQISKEFFRKSLELQYKSFYVQADMLKTMREHYKAFSIQFSNIEKNTSLPEFVKLKNTERIADIVRTNAAQAVYSRLFDRNKYLETVKKRVGRAIDDKVTSITDSINDITDALSMMNEGGPGSGLRAIASIAASMGGDSLGEMVSDKIAPKIQERIKGNKYINTGANYLSAFASSPATLLRSLRDKAYKAEQEGDGGWKTKLLGMARAGLDLTGEERIDTKIRKDSYLDHASPAIFDKSTHRSITEVIPLYLAKILKQNTDLTAMYYNVNKAVVSHPNSSELRYDFANRKFDTAENIKANLIDKVFDRKSASERTKAVASNAISRAKSNLSSNKELGVLQKRQLSVILNNKNANKKLSEYMAKAYEISGIEYDFDTLIHQSDKNADLKELIDKDPELRKIIDVLRSHSDKDNKYLDQSLSDIKRPYPIEGIKNLFKDASKLTNSKQPNIIPDEAAAALSKAISRFILNRGEDFTPQNTLNKLAFGFMTKQEFDKVVPYLTVFIEDVRRIETSGDMLIKSSLLSLFAATNASLKQNIEIDPSVFATIREYYPDFVKGKKLGVENLVEGKLTNADDEEYVPLTDVRNSTKVTKTELLQIREENFAQSGIATIASRLGKKKEQLINNLRAVKNSPVGMVEVLFNEAKSFKSSVASQLKKTSEELSGRFETLSKTVDDIIKDGSTKALTATIEEIAKIESKFDEYIALTQNDIEQKTEELRKAQEAVNDITTSKALQRAAVKELELFIKLGQANLKTLHSLKPSLAKCREGLTRELNAGVKSPTEVLKVLGDNIRQILSTARTKLEELESFTKAAQLTT